MQVSNWGKYPVVDADMVSAGTIEELRRIVKTSDSLVARGMGRCYGDSSLNKKIVSMLRLNRILSFDKRTGVIECEGGVTLADLLETFVTRGWFPAVTPGTKFITVGGALAADVHGKNHHVAGSFSKHTISFKLLTSDGAVRTCSRSLQKDLFWATCGGMGLTGIILSVTFRLKKILSSYIRQETVKTSSLDEVMSAFEESKSWTYSVAWIDCYKAGKSFGRSLLMRGEHATAEEARARGVTGDAFKLPWKFPLAVPFNLPGFILSQPVLKLTNAIISGIRKTGTSEQFIDYDTFFYPLDRIMNWNRLYGRNGFVQYQFVLPKTTSREGLEQVLRAVSRFEYGSFLAVLKLFGKQEGLLSFPREGYTLALDFPVSKELFPFLNELDAIVLAHGGRLYLAKDGRMTAETFAQSYGHRKKFQTVKRNADRRNIFRSLQSSRVGLA